MTDQVQAIFREPIGEAQHSIFKPLLPVIWRYGARASLGIPLVCEEAYYKYLYLTRFPTVSIFRAV